MWKKSVFAKFVSAFTFASVLMTGAATASASDDPENWSEWYDRAWQENLWGSGLVDAGWGDNGGGGGGGDGDGDTWFGSGDEAPVTPEWLATQMVNQGYDWDGDRLSVTIHGTRMADGSAIDNDSSASLDTSGLLSIGDSQFQIINNAGSYPYPDELAIVETNGEGANPMLMAVAPIPIIAFGYSTAINELLMQQRLAQIAQLPNAALRLAAINQLINIMEAARQVGAAISIAQLESIARVERAYRDLVALSKLAPAGGTGAIALRTLATWGSGIGAALTLGSILGTIIYNNNQWLNHGGLDPFFQALENQFSIGGQGLQEPPPEYYEAPYEGGGGY